MSEPPEPPRLRAVPPPRDDEDAAGGDAASASRPAHPDDSPGPRAPLRLVPPLPPDDPPRGAA